MDAPAPTSAPPASSPPRERALSRGSRGLLLGFCVLTLVATNQLYVLASRTATLFAWTIAPPLSAAFLGAGYAAGFVLSVLALRSRSWSRARLPMVTVLVFAVLTLAATLLHLDRFHFAAPGLVARAAAWIWLGVYVVVPVGLVLAVATQGRVARSPVPSPLPAWLAALLGLQAVVMTVVGVALFAAPSTAGVLWSWPLTPLTSRMSAAWLVSLGLAAGAAVAGRDLARVRSLAPAYVVFAVLQLLALVLHGSPVRWASGAAASYLVGLVLAMATGVGGLVVLRARRPLRPADEEDR